MSESVTMNEHGNPNEPRDIRKRSVTLDGRRTSVSLEDVFWEQVQAFAQGDRISANALIESIWMEGDRSENLSSRIRVYCLTRLQKETNREPLRPRDGSVHQEGERREEEGGGATSGAVGS